MAKFLVTYHRQAAPADAASAELTRTAIDAWVAAAGSAVIDPGAPLRAVTQLSGDDPEPDEATGAFQAIDGYCVIEVGSIEAASDQLRSHPLLASGGTLQINEVLGGW
ncbi:MAG: hypothetical protein ACLP01_23085 [Solirubrobacteraceae bacterium]